jgi:predicted nucleotidyltransferase
MWWLRYFRRKSPEKDLQKLVDGLKIALGANLKSVLVFGSLASGEFDERRSNVNVLVLLDSIDYDILHQLHPALTAWLRRGHVLPIVVSRAELAEFARAFPIEFLDMLDHHRVQFGEDPLAGLPVNRQHLRAQCEHDLSLQQLKLRQGIAAAGGNAAKVRSLLVHSLASVLTLFRAVLRLQGETRRLSKMEAARELAGRIGFDVATLGRLETLHLRRATDNLDALTKQYLAMIERVLESLRKA